MNKHRSLRITWLAVVGIAAVAGCGGGGDPKKPDASDGGGPLLKIDPATKSFGSVTLGTMGDPVAFTVTNPGPGTSGILTVSFTGADRTEFVAAPGGCGSALAAGQSCTVNVRLNPTTAGMKAANLVVSGASVNSATAMLTGSGVAAAALKIDPPMPAFGMVAVGAMSMAQTFTVTNGGGAATGMITTALAGAGMADFELGMNTCGAALAPMNTCTIQLTFKPISAGAKTASLTVSAAPGGMATASLSGVATAPGALSISPTPHKFGDTQTMAMSAAQTFTITNNGGATTGAVTVAVAGADATQFAMAMSTCTAGLAPMATCTVQVTFRPTSVGDKAASLTATGAPGGTATAALSGKAIGPAQVAVAPTLLSYGPVVIGSTSMTQEFTVTNSGGVATGVLGVALAGADAAQFTIGSSACNGVALMPAASCAIRISFSPAGMPGMRAATLTITGMPGGMAMAMLSGTALGQGMLTVAPPMHDFGSVGLGAMSASLTFTVTNGGGSVTGPISTTLAGADPGDYQFVAGANGCDKGTLAPMATCTIAMVFKPAGNSTGMKMATVTISASPGGSLAAALMGNAVAPASISLTPPSRDFGSVGTGTMSTDVMFTVTNNGAAATGMLAFSLSGTNADQFTIGTNGCTAPVMPMGTCMVAVRFAPTSTGAKMAQLTAIGNPGGTVSAPLTGTAVPPAALAISPSMQDFGALLAGAMQMTAEIVFTVANNGTATTGALAATIGGANMADFALGMTNTCTMPLAMGATCTVGVKFAPATVGAKVATLDVGGMPGGSISAALTATGLGILSISPDTKDFGMAAVGATDGMMQAFTVRNNSLVGGANSGILTTTFTPGSPAQFTVMSDGCHTMTLAPQASCMIAVKFSPAGTSGMKMGTLQVAGAAGGMASAALTGAAVSALSVTNSPTYDFGPVVVGNFAAQTFTVTNAMNTPTTGVITTAITGADASQFSVALNSCAGQTLAAGLTCTIAVRFIPGTTGDKVATLTLSATPGNSVTSDLKGQGTPAPSLVAMPTMAAFGDVYAASTAAADQTVTISNPTVNSATGTLVFGVTGTGFSISGGTCTVATALTGGQMCTIIVRYAAAAGATAGMKMGSLNVMASPGGMVSAPLTANVLPQLSITPVTHDYGNVVAVTGMVTRTFVVKNDSPTAVSALTAALSGNDAADFLVVVGASNTCGTAPTPNGGMCMLDVQFKPAATGAKVADLTVSGTNVSVVAPLKGAGIQDAQIDFTSNAAVAFGTAAMSTMSGTRVVTVVNGGGVTTGALTATKAGAQGADFVIVTGAVGACVDGTTTLAPGATCTYTLRFAAGGVGARMGTFQVSAATSTPGGSTATLVLSGTGVAAGGLTISPTPQDFGAITAGTASSNVTFTVSNGPGAASAALALAVTGEFAIVNGGSCTAGNTVAAGGTCTVFVTFNPVGAAGPRDGSLNVTAGTVISAALYGRARKPATLVATPSGAYDFGAVTATQSSADYAITLRNDGDVATTAIAAASSGGDSTLFTVPAGGNNCTTLAAGATCTLNVRYTPATAGAAHATTLAITATMGGPLNIALSGNSVAAAALSLNLTTKDFGSQAVGSESTATDITVSNAAGALTTGDLAFALTNGTDYRIDSSACPMKLAGAATCIVKVYFKPTTVGAALAGNLTVSATPGGNPMAALTGAGTSAMTVNTGAFASTTVGTASAEVTFTVTNAAGAPQTGILSTVLAGVDASQFVVSSDGCAGQRLNGAATCDVKVRFLPSTVGVKAAQFTVSGTPGNSATATLGATAL